MKKEIFLERMDDSTRRWFACECAKRALVREREAGREPDPRAWEALRVAREFSLGRASEEDLLTARRDAMRLPLFMGEGEAQAARSAALTAQKDALQAARESSLEAIMAAWEATWVADQAAMMASRAADRSAAREAVWESAGEDVWAEEERWQKALLASLWEWTQDVRPSLLRLLKAREEQIGVTVPAWQEEGEMVLWEG